MAEEVLRWLAPAPSDRVLDLTVGAGGHARRLLERLSEAGRLVGVDRDREILERARESLVDSRVQLVHASFGELARLEPLLDARTFHCVLVDLGVSSLQLDVPERGFSFRTEGPLDMRMDTTRGATAAELLRTLDIEALTRILAEYGEERHARRIARAILREQVRAAIRTTAALARVVRGAIPRRGRARIDPATRTFQALRIAVNDELGALDRLLGGVDRLLEPGGRLAILSYHSLEDRRVKRCFRRLAAEGEFEVATPKPIRPGAEEIRDNPRARSARLRVLRRGPRAEAR